MQDLATELPEEAGSATLDHPDLENVDEETCASPEAETSRPEDALVAEYEPLSLISGAGHDALAMAKLTKASTIPFLK